MDCPVLQTVLDLLHLEKTNRVSAAHHSEGSRNTVTEEVEFIRILSLLLYEHSSLHLYSRKYAVLVGGYRTIVILCDFYNLQTVGLGLSRFEQKYSFVLFGLNLGGLGFIENGMVDVPRVIDTPIDFGGVCKAEIDVETRPIVLNRSTLDVVSSMESYLWRSGWKVCREC